MYIVIDAFLMCKSVELFEFPKQFEGKFVIESLHNHGLSDRCNVAITDTSQIITYKSSFSHHNLSDVCSPVSLVYTIQGEENDTVFSLLQYFTFTHNLKIFY